MENILIFSDKIIDTYEKVMSYIDKYIPSSKKEIKGYHAYDKYVINIQEYKIIIQQYNESSRGYRSNIILYDYDIDFESKEGIELYQNFEYLTIPKRNSKLEEWIIAPVELLRFLFVKDFIYVCENGLFDNKEIAFVTDYIIKAFCYSKKNYSTLTIVRKDKEEGVIGDMLFDENEKENLFRIDFMSKISF